MYNKKESFNYYDIEAVKPAFTLVNYKNKSKHLDVYFLLDKLKMNMFLEQIREENIAKLKENDPNIDTTPYDVMSYEGLYALLKSQIIQFTMKENDIDNRYKFNFYDLSTLEANIHLAKAFGMVTSKDTNNVSEIDAYNNRFRIICDTDVEYNDKKHPYIMGYNSNNYDTTILSHYLERRFFDDRLELYKDQVVCKNGKMTTASELSEGDIVNVIKSGNDNTLIVVTKSAIGNPAINQEGLRFVIFDESKQRMFLIRAVISPSEMRKVNDDMFESEKKYCVKMPKTLADYGQNYNREGWNIRNNMLRSGRHLDVAKLNEKQTKVGLKRLLGFLGHSIIENAHLTNDRDTFDHYSSFVELISYNVSDVIKLEVLASHRTYRGNFEVKKGLLEEYPALIYKQSLEKKDGSGEFPPNAFNGWNANERVDERKYEAHIAPDWVKRYRLYIDSTSAQIVASVLCPYGNIDDYIGVNYMYPSKTIAAEKGIEQINMLERVKELFYEWFPVENPNADEARRQFDAMYNYYKEIEGHNVNESTSYRKMITAMQNGTFKGLYDSIEYDGSYGQNILDDYIESEESAKDPSTPAVTKSGVQTVYTRRKLYGDDTGGYTSKKSFIDYRKRLDEMSDNSDNYGLGSYHPNAGRTDDMIKYTDPFSIDRYQFSDNGAKMGILQYFNADGSPSTCYTKPSIGGIHGEEYYKELFDKDLAVWSVKNEITLAVKSKMMTDSFDVEKFWTDKHITINLEMDIDKDFFRNFIKKFNGEEYTIEEFEQMGVDKRRQYYEKLPLDAKLDEVNYKVNRQGKTVIGTVGKSFNKAHYVSMLVQHAFPDPLDLYLECQKDSPKLIINDIVIELSTLIKSNVTKSRLLSATKEQLVNNLVKDLKAKQPALFVRDKTSNEKSMYVLNTRYSFVSIYLCHHEDFVSYYPGMLMQMEAFYNPYAARDYYKDIYGDKPRYQRLAQEAKDNGDIELSKMYTGKRGGVKLLLNAASGAGAAKYDMNINIANKIMSMRIIGQLSTWCIGQYQTLYGAKIPSTNTDGIYSKLIKFLNDALLNNVENPQGAIIRDEAGNPIRDENNVIMRRTTAYKVNPDGSASAVQAGIALPIGVEIEPEEMLLVSKDSAQRIEIDTDLINHGVDPTTLAQYINEGRLDPILSQMIDDDELMNNIKSASGGSLSCYEDVDVSSNLTHPGIIDNILAKYLTIASIYDSDYEHHNQSLVNKPMNDQILDALLNRLLKQDDKAHVLRTFQNVIASSSSSMTFPVGVNKKTNEYVEMLHYTRAFFLKDDMQVTNVPSQKVIDEGTLSPMRMQLIKHATISSTTRAKSREAAIENLKADGIEPTESAIKQKVLYENRFKMESFKSNEDNLFIYDFLQSKGADMESDAQLLTKEPKVSKVPGVEPEYNAIIYNDSLFAFSDEQADDLLSKLDMNVYKDMIKNKYEDYWRNAATWIDEV